jgi:hypothetical protein
MAKKRVFLVMALAVFSTVFAAGVFAQVTISGGLALSAVDAKIKSTISPRIDTKIGFGGNIYADYLLPVGVPVSLGFEIGVHAAKFIVNESPLSGKKAEETITAVPLLLRAAWHFDLADSLDFYLVGKIGGAFGAWKGDLYDDLGSSGIAVDDIGGFALGIDIGAVYYFTPRFGASAEAGFDRYSLKTKIKAPFGAYSATLEAPFSRFLTFGVSVKF